MGHLAIDLGANGGKAYVGRFDGGLTVDEVHRFDNRPVERGGRYVWDVEHLLSGIVRSIERADARGAVETVGIDTWGVDFGLLADGSLLRAPTSYRDPAVTSTRDEILDRLTRREIFEATGINHWNTPNTLWQYHHLVTRERETFEAADRLLMTPQLLSVLLGGRPAGERTIASTTQMLDPRSGTWAEGLLDELDLPTGPLPAVEPAGATLGTLDPDIAGDTESTPELVSTASHDTAAAVAALPFAGEGRLFLSTGTWFIPGVELDAPRIDDRAFAAGASNELGVDGSVRFLKNVTGFFLLEECREAWDGTGPLAYEELVAAAREAEPFGPLVDPDADRFDIEGEMPARIRAYCEATGQRPPGDRGELTRCIFESLATRTALAVEELLDVAGVDADRLHLGGGGVRNDLFCELLASAVGRPVFAGPADATAIGNVLTQAVATGALDDVATGREYVREAFAPTEYEPGREAGWADAKSRMRDLLANPPES
ncbi:rhamnulokinase [Halobacteriales archaeon QS_1_68_17]|nr:MAG: rhamnulokinase [Halobacteriales archaeon QS_1_68_17]